MTRLDERSQTAHGFLVALHKQLRTEGGLLNLVKARRVAAAVAACALVVTACSKQPSVEPMFPAPPERPAQISDFAETLQNPALGASANAIGQLRHQVDDGRREAKFLVYRLSPPWDRDKVVAYYAERAMKAGYVATVSPVPNAVPVRPSDYQQLFVPAAAPDQPVSLVWLAPRDGGQDTLLMTVSLETERPG